MCASTEQFIKDCPKNTNVQRGGGRPRDVACAVVGRLVGIASGTSLLRTHSCHVWLECISCFVFALLCLVLGKTLKGFHRGQHEEVHQQNVSVPSFTDAATTTVQTSPYDEDSNAVADEIKKSLVNIWGEFGNVAGVSEASTTSSGTSTPSVVYEEIFDITRLRLKLHLHRDCRACTWNVRYVRQCEVWEEPVFFYLESSSTAS